MKRRGRPPHPDIFTPREWEALELLRQGLTNEQIAQQLGISLNGAKYHVSEILSKLGVGSRQEAANWLPSAERPWWAASVAPLGWLVHRLSLSAAMKAAGASVVVATAGGLAFLGWTLVTIPKTDLEAVPTGFFGFSNLTVDADGAVWWVGPGLSRFDPDSGALRTFTLADDPAFEHVWSIAPAREGGIWMLSPPSRSVVRRFDGEQFQEILGPGSVCELAVAPDGTLWGAGCGGGVFHWDGGSWVQAASAGDTPLGAWKGRQPGFQHFPGTIAVDTGGQVWVANHQYGADWESIGFGVSRFDGTAWTTWTEREGLPSDLVSTIAPGPGGEVWVGTSVGVARFLDGAWVAYPGAGTEVPHDSIAVTDQGVWVAGWTGNAGRIVRFDGGAWIPQTSEDGLGQLRAHPSVAAGEEGPVWATTDVGLFVFDGTRWKRVVPSGQQPMLLPSLAAAGSDEVWATDGTHVSDDSYQGQEGEVWRLKGGTWTSFGEDDGLPGGLVSEIAVGPDGVPWVSTKQGLARFDGSAWQQVDFGQHHAIAFGPDGRVWTASGSTVRPVGGTAVPGPSPLLHYVTHFGVGPGGQVWASCERFWGGEDCGLALAHFDGEAWETVEPPKTAGAPLVGLLDLEVTSEGDVWISGPGADALVVMRYRDGEWTEFREADMRLGFDPPSEAGWSGGGLMDSRPDGTLLLVTDGGLAAFRDGSWSPVLGGTFHGLSVAPDGTVWLLGDGLFRLTDLSPHRVVFRPD